MNETSFMERAACRGLDPEMFFPLPRQFDAQDAAEAVCAQCPVRRQCADFADRNGLVGVWGGTFRT